MEEKVVAQKKKGCHRCGCTNYYSIFDGRLFVKYRCPKCSHTWVEEKLQVIKVEE